MKHFIIKICLCMTLLPTYTLSMDTQKFEGYMEEGWSLSFVDKTTLSAEDTKTVNTIIARLTPITARNNPAIMSNDDIRATYSGYSTLEYLLKKYPENDQLKKQITVLHQQLRELKDNHQAKKKQTFEKIVGLQKAVDEKPNDMIALLALLQAQHPKVKFVIPSPISRTFSIAPANAHMPAAPVMDEQQTLQEWWEENKRAF